VQDCTLCAHIVRACTIGQPRIQHARRRMMHRPADSVPVDSRSLISARVSSRIPLRDLARGQMHVAHYDRAHYAAEQFYTVDDNNRYYFKMQISPAQSERAGIARCCGESSTVSRAGRAYRVATEENDRKCALRALDECVADLLQSSRNPRKNSIGDFLPRFDNGIFLARNFKRAVAARI